MALTVAGKSLTEAHRIQQALLAGHAAAGLSPLTADVLDPFRLDATRADWLGLSLMWLQSQARDSEALAAAYLAAYRGAEAGMSASRMPIIGVGTSFDTIATVGSLNQVIVRAKRDTAAGRAPKEAVGAALDAMLGASERHVLNAGRNVVAESTGANRESIGWRRVSDGKPCSFCAMLASRGPAYRSRVTALGLTRYHDFCGCSAEEVFGEWNPTSLEMAWIDAYDRAAEIADEKYGARTEEAILPLLRGQDGGLFNDSARPDRNT